MGYLKRLKTSGSVSLEAFKMYYAMRASAPSLHRESTDSLIYSTVRGVIMCSKILGWLTPQSQTGRPDLCACAH